MHASLLALGKARLERQRLGLRTRLALCVVPRIFQIFLNFEILNIALRDRRRFDQPMGLVCRSTPNSFHRKFPRFTPLTLLSFHHRQARQTPRGAYRTSSRKTVLIVETIASCVEALGLRNVSPDGEQLFCLFRERREFGHTGGSCAETFGKTYVYRPRGRARREGEQGELPESLQWAGRAENPMCWDCCIGVQGDSRALFAVRFFYMFLG